MKVIMMHKRTEGEPEAIDEREWSVDMLAALEHANYVVLNGSEYEMLEGRLNVDKMALEVLVVSVADRDGER
jgi:hypothetical protein